MGGESSLDMDGSGGTRVAGAPLFDQFPPDFPIVHEGVVNERASGRRGYEVDDESVITSAGGALSIAVGCQSEGVTFDGADGRAGLISETETALDTAGLPIC